MKLDFKKYADGLIPAIIQDVDTDKVLMLGFMNEEALEKTKQSGDVTFFSRTKQRLWTKGEESGNFLEVKEIIADCDQDTLLIKAHPTGPICHTGADTCWNEVNKPNGFLGELEAVIAERRASQDPDKSYVAWLFSKGINRIAQKVGEEAVEVVVEAKDNNEDLFLNEGADLLFHFLVLLNAKGYRLSDVIKVLEDRHKEKDGDDK